MPPLGGAAEGWPLVLGESGAAMGLRMEIGIMHDLICQKPRRRGRVVQDEVMQDSLSSTVLGSFCGDIGQLSTHRKRVSSGFSAADGSLWLTCAVRQAAHTRAFLLEVRLKKNG